MTSAATSSIFQVKTPKLEKLGIYRHEVMSFNGSE